MLSNETQNNLHVSGLMWDGEEGDIATKFFDVEEFKVPRIAVQSADGAEIAGDVPKTLKVNYLVDPDALEVRVWTVDIHTSQVRFENETVERIVFSHDGRLPTDTPWFNQELSRLVDVVAGWFEIEGINILALDKLKVEYSSPALA